MRSPQDLAAEIKRRLKDRGETVSDMLSECGLSKNTLSSMAGGYYPRLEAFTKIADYLECPADELLGRKITFDSSVLRRFDKAAQPDPETTAALRRMMDETITVAYYNAPEEIRSAADRLLDPYKPEKSKDAPAS